MTFGVRVRSNSLVGIHRSFDPDLEFAGRRCGAVEFDSAFYDGTGLNAGITRDIDVLLPAVTNPHLLFNLESTKELALLRGCVATRLFDLYLDHPRSEPCDEVNWMEPIVNCESELEELLKSDSLAQVQRESTETLHAFFIMAIGGVTEEQHKDLHKKIYGH